TGASAHVAQYDHVPNIQSTAPTTAMATTALVLSAPQNDHDDDKDDERKKGFKGKALAFPKITVFGELSGQYLKNGIRTVVQSTVIVPFFKLGDDNGLNDALGHEVSERAFHAIAGVYRNPSVLLGQKNEYAVVLISLANAPFLAPLCPEVTNVLSL